MKYKVSSKTRAWRVRGKGSEEVREVSSPLGIRSYKEFGFCPKEATEGFCAGAQD